MVDPERASGEQREAASRELELSHERFRAFIEATRDLLYCFEVPEPVDPSWPREERVARLDDAVLVECNEAYARSRGRTRAEVLGLSLRELRKIDDATMTELFERLLDGGDALDGARIELEDWGGGGKRICVASVRATLEAGRLVRFWGSLTDVTESARAEARIRALLEHAADVVMLLDIERIVRFVTPSIRRVVGYEPDEVLGTDGVHLIHPDDVGLVQQSLASALEDEGRAVSATFRVRHADGSWRHVDGVAVSRLNEPSVGAVVVSARDATERVEAEARAKQSQKLEALGLLAGGVAHDFNNLLTAVLANAELLGDRAMSEEARQESVASILAAGHRAAELTRDLLAFARRGDLARHQVDVTAAIAEAVRLLSRSIDRRITVRTDLGDEHLLVMADPAQLSSALLNLALNARDAMPDGGTLTFAARKVEVEPADERGSEPLAPGPYVEISVSDTGAGIPEAALPRIFEPFFTTKPLGKGTGLGLAAVYGFVRAQLGTLRVETAQGEGTTMRMLLPRTAGGDTPHQILPLAPPRGSGHVLVIDDEEIVARVVRRALERAGYSVTVASGGEEGLRLVDAAQTPFGLVLLDLNMPGMTGLQVFRALRERDAEIPVVVLSGYGASEMVDGARQAGVRVFLHKPFRIEELARTVASEIRAAR